MRRHTYHLDLKTTADRLGIFPQGSNRRGVLLATAACFQTRHDRRLGRHPFGNLSLSQSGIFSRPQQLIEQCELRLQRIVLSDKAWILHPALNHFIVCFHRNHLLSRSCTSAWRLRATSSSLCGVFRDFLI